MTSEFLPLELNNVDVILGIQWLETLGEMRVNWKLQTMKVPYEGRVVTLQGQPELCSSEVSCKAMKRLLEKQEVGMIIECREVSIEKVWTQGTPKEMTSVLKGFTQVFDEPDGLPPSRGREHAINLIQ